MGTSRHDRITRFSSRFDIGLIGVVLLSLPALIPLLRSGYFESHDGWLHLYRLVGLDQAIASGNFYPRWFSDFAFGYGHPVLNFYGPLPYYIAEVFQILGAGYAAAMKCAYGLGLALAGVTMYLFARRALEHRVWPAIIAAIAYVYAPYHLANLYVRGALAELLAMAWTPLILWSLTRLVLDRKRVHLLVIAAGLAGLVATHSLSLVLIGPVLVAYTLILLVVTRRTRPLTLIAGAVVLALGLSAFYWLPMLLESQYVGLATTTSAGYQEHLAPLDSFVETSLFYRYFPNQRTEASYPAGLWQWLLALPGAALLFGRRVKPATRAVVGLMLAVALIGLFMTLQISQPIWHILEPALAFLQYPWRFAAVSALGVSLLTGATVLVLIVLPGRAFWRRSGHTLMLLLIIVLALSATRELPYTPTPAVDEATIITRMWTEEREVGQIGTTWTGEYVPAWVEEQRWAIGRSWLEAGGPDLVEANAKRPPDRVFLRQAESGRLVLDAQNLAPSTLILHQFYYPGMGATVAGASADERRIEAYAFGALGLTAIDLPAGEYTLTVGHFATAMQQIGWIVSLVAAVVLLILLGRLGSRRALGVAFGLALLLASIFLMRHWTTQAPAAPASIQAELEGRASLLAYQADASQAQAGDTVTVSLYWLARGGFADDLVTFVHLTPAAAPNILAQTDQQPDGGFTPTTRWLAGEIVPDRHQLTLPTDLSPGSYALYAGMYEPDPLRNLEIISSDQPMQGGRVLLGYLEITAP